MINDELGQLWRTRAHTRGIRIRDLEKEIEDLKSKNAELATAAQAWRAKYKSLTGVLKKLKQTNLYLYKILKRIPGYGEA
jgi:FtsZ-binding cell division protein ZapB